MGDDMVLVGFIISLAAIMAWVLWSFSRMLKEDEHERD